ncbi:hypothetical protein EG346_19950 [Chryseobacterium carnipullorum]|uniref:Uncharacterized protein n=1 Tax=Chryseobacterium carnipullorum TaxID=1124835 RepID=A0A376DYV6_CHRCU|nr:hypothetical protein [Chryseobacterium carnipullorum]AZA50309.1 hypothetical protein EG346_19950 [Chryseobacterium carnipullorum]AZA65182.1 hypothetical protein EG345_11005 [Chryseobacterium carnipullorum]STC98389.1 Uncharacterised protein [Chryseobacterium carnipullorum]HBV14378.1 hypothetical protein [Chryseobacterium carnipullorum]
MKLMAIVREEILPGDQSIIVEFHSDENKRHYELHCTFDPYQKGIRKWDTWEFKTRLESEIFIDPKTDHKSYFTHLFCDEATEVNSPYIKQKKSASI